MSKSICSLILISSLSLIAVPASSAENMGTDPKPRVGEVTERTMVEYLQFGILSYFGF
jgi:hypothetical protein